MLDSCVWFRCAEPEVHSHTLITEDEFMVVACDGLWDMLSSQRCVEIARQHLRDHNDPQTCAQFLVRGVPNRAQSQRCHLHVSASSQHPEWCRM